MLASKMEVKGGSVAQDKGRLHNPALGSDQTFQMILVKEADVTSDKGFFRILLHCREFLRDDFWCFEAVLSERIR